ncbi:bifunctional diguanylate cyclase/phosphodiesterase [Undibacterium sp. Jales W-56]|uniref:putative bifunctional diguanylate cyclase/phosphodiesterase n=1 Tax=Undibacterium sp. Jales W-56 TaxID=2897325 RepID=UPI0021CE388E|nr:bifunctional diguanylate cyclase/phosphodiesterase [Undibacterium sp. Jales W-56]MCU6432527.1 bifunctional diguanylate cyclase/phosphodiesterase [Undibacterium sp. Jales W-56]
MVSLWKLNQQACLALNKQTTLFMMFRWFSLSESAFDPSDDAAWKISALRMVLMSGLLLQTIVAIDSSRNAVAVGTYYVLSIVGLFYAILSLALYYSAHHLRLSAGILIATVYAAAFFMIGFIDQPEITGFAFIFIYTTPLLARLFFTSRLAVILMAFNTLPFFFLLRTQSISNFPGIHIGLQDSHIYVPTLLFLFFNIGIPLAVFRVLQVFDASALRQRKATTELEISRDQYYEIFQNAGSALLLTDPHGIILQANNLANTLLGRAMQHDASSSVGEAALFDWLSLDNSIRLKGGNPEDGANLRMSAYRTRDGKLVAMENIAQTKNEHYIVALRDVSNLYSIHNALELSQERESYLSNHDKLTRLPDRDMLRKHLKDVLAKTDQGKVTALVSFRLNSIRHANQKLGIYIGDILLRRFAEELTAALPQNSFCARLRSIVFSFVVDQFTTPGEIIKMVEHVRHALPKEIDIDGENLLIQFSAGIALVRPGESEPDDLIRRSEVALDTARRSSDPGATLFDEEDEAEIRRSVEIEMGIVSGLKQKEFRLVYQPKVTRDGTLAGVEALLRWRSASLGNVSPVEFIEIAERTGLIRDISNFVLDNACAQIRSWLDQFGFSPVVAVNLSASDMARNDLLVLIDGICAQHGVAPEYLEFEITETGLIANEGQAITYLNQLKERGFGIAIDDFGTGYSSLSKLSHFPARSVKIDRSFVAQIGHNQKSEMIIKAIVSLATILSCKTVAEGVENLAQETFLKDIGCDYFQGYLYYRPLEIASMNQLLETNTVFAMT